ncbi:MAG: DUF1801 domain-containing protein [Bacillota bacterium]|nr:MAG: DUF1801 domain-containing protein [Bacillota bacterium]
MEITEQNVERFINQIPEPRHSDIVKLVELGKKLTKKDPKMWGTIIGFGNLHYTYKTGHEGDMPLFGLANRKQAITLYVSYTLDKYPQLNKLGKFTKGVSCLYIKKLSDIDMDVLESLIEEAIADTMKISFIKDNEKEENQ